MPTIYDNIVRKLLPAIQESIRSSFRGDFCVGYFRLSGWSHISKFVEAWEGGPEKQCRLLVGMHVNYDDATRQIVEELEQHPEAMDARKLTLLKRACAREFQKQLTTEIPSNRIESDLRTLVRQIRAKKLVVKLSVQSPLHAKLYLFARNDQQFKRIGYLGSSNLTHSGISSQGELNIDVLDQQACDDLQKWFDTRWNDEWCIDISKDLCAIIDASWAREEPLAPFLVYAKMLFHLSEEARQGLMDFNVPPDIRARLFDFQEVAVKVAAKILSQRGGVMLGDVVGLGKTRMAAVLARMFEDDFGALIVCPPKLVPMWEDYKRDYGLRGEVLSSGKLERDLPNFRPYRLVIVDESHNFRSREGARHKALRSYIERCGAQVILMSATPYNMAFSDLANQLRLFLRDDEPLGIQPEVAIRKCGDVATFQRKYDCSPRILDAFEKSCEPADWVQLMGRYLVRRTRKYIVRNYATLDAEKDRAYLVKADGSRAYFPKRIPKNVTFDVDTVAAADQYSRLYSPSVVDRINDLALPRYGLGGYLNDATTKAAVGKEQTLIEDIARGRQRLRGFCRTNLFKRLESSGPAFLESVERHILRDFVYLHAIENGLPIPIGVQDPALFDPIQADDDGTRVDDVTRQLHSEAEYRARAAAVYAGERDDRRFRWLDARYVTPELHDHLLADTQVLLALLDECGQWDAVADRKVAALVKLLSEDHPREKVLIFTQFADTADYLERELLARGLTGLAVATGTSDDPTTLAHRFSPVSNDDPKVTPDRELRVLISTDVLSEGQNLQDSHIVVNFDLPWAIVRLIQRAGRVDRIGQESQTVTCYSFLPEAGVEEIISLRARLRTRLKQNGEVIGSDETFFGDEVEDEKLHDLYSGKAGILDEEDDSVDLVSFALEQWQRAVDADPTLEKRISALQDVVYATKTAPQPGALVYVRTEYGNDVLTWVTNDESEVSSNPIEVLREAACSPETPGHMRPDTHHALVKATYDRIEATEKDESQVSSLGAPTTVRRRVYTRLRPLLQAHTLGLETNAFSRAMEQLHRHPLLSSANQILAQQLRTAVADDALANTLVSLSQAERLVVPGATVEHAKTQIICSMALLPPERHA